MALNVLKFIKLSKYALSLVSNPMDEMSHFLTGVSNDLEEECRSSILHDNMNILVSWFMLNKWKKLGKGEREGRLRRTSLMKVFLERVGLTFNTSVGSRRGFLINFPQNFPRLVMIGCLTLSLKKKEVLAHQARSQLVESVSRSIMVIALSGWTIALGVARMATSLGIAQI